MYDADDLTLVNELVGRAAKTHTGTSPTSRIDATGPLDHNLQV